MNKKHYNNVIDWTLKHDQTAQTEDSLATARAVFNNMGVALPNGSMQEVYDTIKTNKYMGWRACTMQEAQKAANKGTAAIGISKDRVVILSATDEEEPVAETASVMTLSENTSAYAVAGLEFYLYDRITTSCGTMWIPTYRVLTKYQTENDCYKAAKPIGTVKGIVVHSTGAPNPELRRYVDYPEELGSNSYNNHWNMAGVRLMVHAFIGYDKNQDIAIVNTLPYSYACWGCGAGDNGSYNNGYIQFEICEDSTQDEAYFNEAVFGAAVQYCAYLCNTFSLSVDSIVSHKEAHDLGYASNHGDPDHWLTIYGKTMDDFRNAVRAKSCI